METIIFRDLACGHQCEDCDGLHHDKSIPGFSVVQALHGSYDIGLDDGPILSTGEGGVFITPPGCLQHITHHNGSEHYMEAHWLYFNARIDGDIPLEHLRKFPLLLPPNHNEEAARLIVAARSGSLCHRYAAAYTLLDLLLRYSEETERPDSFSRQLQEFVYLHSEERLDAGALAAALHCSVSQIFRLTQKYFQKTPAHYINSVRLQKAAWLLECSDRPIKEIALSCGFCDTAYFSRLFSRTFLIAPSRYRRIRQPIP